MEEETKTPEMETPETENPEPTVYSETPGVPETPIVDSGEELPEGNNAEVGGEEDESEEDESLEPQNQEYHPEDDDSEKPMDTDENEA